MRGEEEWLRVSKKGKKKSFKKRAKKLKVLKIMFNLENYTDSDTHFSADTRPTWSKPPRDEEGKFRQRLKIRRCLPDEQWEKGRPRKTVYLRNNGG